MHRRTFGRLLSSTLVLPMVRNLFGVEADGMPAVCIFSKHLQWLDYESMAETAASLGFDGIDLTVRPGGHVEPEWVAEELPRACRAIRSAGLQVPTITTAVVDTSNPADLQVLQAAADEGISFYRMGYLRYEPGRSLDDLLERARVQFAGLAEVNRQLGICGDYQNHAGEGYLGASLWDLWHVLRDLDPRWIGCQFDLRHATVEGTKSWPIDFRRLVDRVHTCVVKDFRWNEEAGTPEVENRPLGEGVAEFDRFLPMLGETGFSGPMSLHFEYSLGGANHGARELEMSQEVVESSMRRDLTTLKNWLAESGLS